MVLVAAPCLCLQSTFTARVLRLQSELIFNLSVDPAAAAVAGEVFDPASRASSSVESVLQCGNS